MKFILLLVTGAVVGIALAAAILCGVIEFAEWMVEII